MKKIVLINVFMGEFPWYFDYFLKSCSYNPTVDFLIFNNSNYTRPLPDNVAVVDFSLSDFNEQASSKLRMNISVQNAYKLCDFKPAYGVIFSEFIKGYDFWGICDIDIIFGRIREFMTDTLLSEHDVISVRDDFPTGYFMLFKNEEKINYLFTKSKDHRKVFHSPKHLCFDESNFKQIDVIAGANILEIPSEIESMHHVLEKEKDQVNVFWDFLIQEGHPGKLKWNKGQLILRSKYEVLLFHLRIFKTNVLVRKKLPHRITEKFRIHRHHIQNASFNFFKVLYNYWKYDKINPFLHRITLKLDYLISSKVYQPSALSLKKGSVFSDGFIFLKKYNGKYTSIAFAGGAKEYSPLISSCFDRSVFFALGNAKQKYIFSEISQDQIDYLKVNRIGNISKNHLMLKKRDV